MAYVGDRPANEDNSVVALGHFLTSAVVGYRYKGFRVFVEVQNLLNVEWNEAQFDTESRLFLDPLPVSELHYTPGIPFGLQAGISYEF